MNNSIFDKVLFVGPDMKARGGIASVLESYSTVLPKFHYMPTNSRKGTLCGVLNLICTMLRIPFFRLFKSDKIIHIHGAAGKSYVRKSWIIHWTKFWGYKVVFHSHSGHIKDYIESRGEVNVRKTLDKCDYIVALSQMWKQYFEKDLGYKNVKVVNNIVYPEANVIPNTRKQVLKLLFLGLVCDNKGIFDLIDVIIEHKKEFEGRLELCVGGVGDDDRLRNLISDNELKNIVKPLGWISGESKNNMLADCDIFILPSYVEGVPISILEAMANSKAVIASNVGGIPEIVKDGVNGMLHAPGDKDAIYRAIKYCLDNPSQIKIYGKLGAEIVKDYYPSAVVSQLQELYAQLLAKS